MVNDRTCGSGAHARAPFTEASADAPHSRPGARGDAHAPAMTAGTSGRLWVVVQYGGGTPLEAWRCARSPAARRTPGRIERTSPECLAPAMRARDRWRDPER